MSCNCAIFASGRGSNALNLIDFFFQDYQGFFCPKVVFSDNPKAKVLEKVQGLEHSKSLEVFSLNPKEFESKADFEKALLEKLHKHNIKWIFLAGYMRILSKNFLSHYYDQKIQKNRVVNIHPSLLPKHPGLNAYEKCFESKEPMGGVSVHFVDEGVDSGEIIVQQSFERCVDDDFDSFQSRGLRLEHELYPQAIKKIEATYELSQT